jgi:hypothetical protein
MAKTLKTLVLKLPGILLASLKGIPYHAVVDIHK